MLSWHMKKYTYAANSSATFCGILHVCAMTRVHLCDMTHVYIRMQESVVQLAAVVHVAITWLMCMCVTRLMCLSLFRKQRRNTLDDMCTRLYAHVYMSRSRRTRIRCLIRMHQSRGVRIRWYLYAGNSGATVCGGLHVRNVWHKWYTCLYIRIQVRYFGDICDFILFGNHLDQRATRDCGMAATSRLLQIMGLFFKRDL